MDKKWVIYNGRRMIAGWPEKIEQAQLLKTLTINGQVYERIRYGDERSDWNADRVPCHDCGVIKGQFHVGPACDVEECPRCGGQLIGCDCDVEDESPV